MTIQQAIEKAVEGGYHRGQIGTSPIVEINCDFAITETKGERNHYGLAWVWLDPLFWQSIGKAMGWSKELVCARCGLHGCDNCYFENRWVIQQEWLYQWHRFVDALAEGKSAEDFFKEL